MGTYIEFFYQWWEKDKDGDLIAAGIFTRIIFISILMTSFYRSIMPSIMNIIKISTIPEVYIIEELKWISHYEVK